MVRWMGFKPGRHASYMGALTNLLIAAQRLSEALLWRRLFSLVKTQKSGQRTRRPKHEIVGHKQQERQSRNMIRHVKHKNYVLKQYFGPIICARRILLVLWVHLVAQMLNTRYRMNLESTTYKVQYSSHKV